LINDVRIPLTNVLEIYPFDHFIKFNQFNSN